MSDLVEQIDALLALNAKGAVSHPVPGLAVELLERAKAELSLRQSHSTGAVAWELLTVDDVERIILETEPSQLSDRGDQVWTRRMATALAARFSALSALPLPTHTEPSP